MTVKPLTPEEARVILQKGTEPPFSGAFVDHHADGTYTCRQCGAELYRSTAKFDSGCGWPSFDDAVPGAVAKAPDRDGRRTEILCARCGGHLGHVFTGEGFTPKDVRHCVNSLSLDFVAAPPAAAEAFFAGGCFWGVEHGFEKAPGVVKAESGYMGGTLAAPSYEDVCTGETGHAETVRVVYDPARTTYEALARLFFEIHDPTQRGRQGPDIGPQYRSAVFYRTAEERRTVERLIERLKARGYAVVTELVPAGPFFEAEAYHQDYYLRTGKTPYCHARVPRFGE